MTKTAEINLMVDSEIKEQSGRILDAMGLTFSDAFNLLLHQIKIQQALPFDIVSFSHIPKSDTIEFINQIENGKERLFGPFSSKEELWEALEI